MCARLARRLGEAEALFKRVLEIEEAKLGRDDLQVAVTLHEMAVCVRQAGRPGEAEGVLKRALEIKETKLGSDHVDVAVTLHAMGVCVCAAGGAARRGGSFVYACAADCGGQEGGHGHHFVLVVY